MSYFDNLRFEEIDNERLLFQYELDTSREQIRELKELYAHSMSEKQLLNARRKLTDLTFRLTMSKMLFPLICTIQECKDKPFVNDLIHIYNKIKKARYLERSLLDHWNNILYSDCNLVRSI